MTAGFNIWALASGAVLALISAWVGSMWNRRNTLSHWIRDKRLQAYIGITKAVSELVVESEKFERTPQQASMERFEAALHRLRDETDTLLWIGTIGVNRAAWALCDFFGVAVGSVIDHGQRHPPEVWAELMHSHNEYQAKFDYEARLSLDLVPNDLIANGVRVARRLLGPIRQKIGF